MTATSSAIAAALHDAPAWALIGMTMPDEQMRERGVAELANWIAARLDQGPAPHAPAGSTALIGERP